MSENKRPAPKSSQPTSAKSTGSGTGKKSNAPQGKKKKKGAYHGVRLVINTFSYVVLILGVSLILATFAILIANDVLALVKTEIFVTLEVEEPLSPGEMAKTLKDSGIIEYEWVFKLFSDFKDVDEFKKGTFDLDSNMDYGQIMNVLMRASTYKETVMVTIPEGYSLQQIAELLDDEMVCTEDDFFETANTYAYKHEVLKEVPMVENRLEGYLFPDTYEFYKNDNPIYVINKMLNNFEKKYTKEMRTLTEEAGMTIAEVVNIASMVEKEAKLDNERSTISGVIHNRLDNKDYLYLNIDATLLYVLGHKEKLTNEDLKIDSPYNTYTTPGLPPTAICNPGISCILAAISPEDHDYYYYVADPADGSHIFSKNLQEHNAAIEKVRGS